VEDDRGQDAEGEQGDRGVSRREPREDAQAPDELGQDDERQKPPSTPPDCM
jgi:hypothetical protein